MNMRNRKQQQHKKNLWFLGTFQSRNMLSDYTVLAANHLSVLSLGRYQTNPLYHCLLASFLKLQSGAHRFKHQMTLMCNICKHVSEYNTQWYKIHFKNLKIDDWRYCESESVLGAYKNTTGIVNYHENCRESLISYFYFLVYVLLCRWIRKTYNLNKIQVLFNVWIQHVSSCYNEWEKKNINTSKDRS